MFLFGPKQTSELKVRIRFKTSKPSVTECDNVFCSYRSQTDIVQSSQLDWAR